MMSPPFPLALLLLLLPTSRCLGRSGGGGAMSELLPQDVMVAVGSSFTWSCSLAQEQLSAIERSCTARDIVWKLAGELLAPPEARLSVDPASPGTVALLTVPLYARLGAAKLTCLLRCNAMEKLLAVADVCGAPAPEEPANVTYVLWPNLDGDLTCSWDPLPTSCLATNYTVFISAWERRTQHACGAVTAGRCVISRVDFQVFTDVTFQLTADSRLGRAENRQQFDPANYLKTNPPTLDMSDFSDSWYPFVRWSRPPDLDDLSVKLKYHLRYRPANPPGQPWTDVVEPQGGSWFHSLPPATTYTIQLRCMGSPQQVLWSDWAEANGTTAEMAPVASPEVWSYVSADDSTGQRKVIVVWKPLPGAVARGLVRCYDVRPEGAGCFSSSSVACDNATSVAVATEQCDVTAATPGCRAELWAGAGVCRVAVTAQNSAGRGPPATVVVPAVGAAGPKAPGSVSAEGTSDGAGVRVSWAAPSSRAAGAGGGDGGTVAAPAYVVTWCPVSAPPDVFRHNFLWLGAGNTSVEIRDGMPAGERMEVTVSAVYADGDASRPVAVLAYSRQLVPLRGPSVTTQSVTEAGATVEWAELPVNESRGFITNYTVYYRATDPAGDLRGVSRAAAEPRRLALRDLEAGARYVLSVRAATQAGQGPAGTEHTFAVPHSTQRVIHLAVWLVIMVVLTGTIAILCHLKRRKLLFWQHIPDPADSKLFKTLDLDAKSSSSTSSLEDVSVSPVTVSGDAGKGGKRHASVIVAYDLKEDHDGDDDDSKSSSGVGSSSGLSTPRRCSLADPAATATATTTTTAATTPRVIVSNGYFKTRPVSSGLEIIHLALGPAGACPGPPGACSGPPGEGASDDGAELRAAGTASVTGGATGETAEDVCRRDAGPDGEAEDEETGLSVSDLQYGGGSGGFGTGFSADFGTDFSDLMSAPNRALAPAPTIPGGPQLKQLNFDDFRKLMGI